MPTWCGLGPALPPSASRSATPTYYGQDPRGFFKPRKSLHSYLLGVWAPWGTMGHHRAPWGTTGHHGAPPGTTGHAGHAGHHGAPWGRDTGHHGAVIAQSPRRQRNLVTVE